MITPRYAGNTVICPPHLEHPDVWQLGDSGPLGLYNYLTWILRDEVRTASAVEQMRFNGVGFHYLPVMQEIDPMGNVVDKIDINIFSQEFPTTNASPDGAHAHTRNMQIWSLYAPGDHQSVQKFRILRPKAPIIPGIPAEEYELSILNKTVAPDGIGTIYKPLRLDMDREVCLATSDLMRVPPLAYQIYDSTDIHAVAWDGEHTGATVLRQGPVEHPRLNTRQGLIYYKDLTRREAAATIRYRKKLSRLGQLVTASSVLLRAPGDDIEQMEERPWRIKPDRFVYLAEGAIDSLESLMRAESIRAVDSRYYYFPFRGSS